MGKNSRSGTNTPDHFSESLETIFFGLKSVYFFTLDPGSGWKKFGSGINIHGPQLVTDKPGRRVEATSWFRCWVSWLACCPRSMFGYLYG
jgi:hypothetical protein